MASVITSLLGGWRLYALAGLAGIALCVGLYQAGVNAERKRGEAAQLRVEIETIQRDKAIAEKARGDAERAAAELATINQQNEEALDALRTALANGPEDDRCPASAAVLDLLYP